MNYAMGFECSSAAAAAGQTVFRPETVPARTIAKWLREETNDYYTRHQRYPIGREAEDVVDNAYVQIVKAGIWIPYGEVYQYYLSRKARMMKHPLQG